MLRLLPHFTLFPYTTLFRSLFLQFFFVTKNEHVWFKYPGIPEILLFSHFFTIFFITKINRSEEHTSELQSHVNTVCRLLLENKTTSGASPARAGCSSSDWSR